MQFISHGIDTDVQLLTMLTGMDSTGAPVWGDITCGNVHASTSLIAKLQSCPSVTIGNFCFLGSCH